MADLRDIHRTRKRDTHTLIALSFPNAGGDAVSGTTHRRSAVGMSLRRSRSVSYLYSFDFQILQLSAAISVLYYTTDFLSCLHLMRGSQKTDNLFLRRPAIVGFMFWLF